MGSLVPGRIGGKKIKRAMDYNLAVALPPKTPPSSSSSIHFLGILKQPESDSRPSLDELDERDVIWPPHLKPDPFDPHSDPDTESESEPDLSSPGTQHHRLYPSSGFGLSAVFAEDRGGLTIRRPTRSLTGRTGSGLDLLAKSAPVNVPTWRGRRRRRPHFDDTLDDVEEDDDDDEEEGEMVPPHVIVARSHVMTFSVFEGVGRTLKGRDLRRVRNAVFQQTGFLD